MCAAQLVEVDVRVFVTGLPRSGTGYIAEVLRRLQLDVGHEVQGRDGMVAWKLTSGYLDHEVGADAVKLHQVRHPVNCIASMESLIDRNLQLIGDHVGIVDTDVRSVRFRMEAWVRWNARSGAWADHSYRVEALPEMWDEFCGWIGVAPRAEALDVSTKTNARPGRSHPLTLDDLRAVDVALCDEVTELARKYGYSV
jgi:hypothetical protein